MTLSPLTLIDESTILRASGRYTEDEIVRADGYGRLTWRFALRRAILPFIAWPLAVGFFQPRMVTIPAGFAIAATCWVIAITWAPRSASRQRFRQDPAVRGELQLQLDLRRFVICSRLATGEVSESSIEWSEVLGAIDYETEILLILKSGYRILIPRRFVSTDSEWQLLKNILIAAKDALGSSEKKNLQPPDLGEGAIILPAVRVTWRDIAQAVEGYQIRARQMSVAILIAILIGTAAVAVIASIHSAITGLSARTTLVVIGVTAIAGLVVSFVVYAMGWLVERPIRRLQLWWRLRRLPDLGAPTRVALSQRGIEFQTLSSTGRLAWSEFTDYRATNEWIAMRFADGRLAVLPRRDCGADWDRITSLVHRQLGHCGCGYALRGTTCAACPECGTEVAVVGCR